MSDSRFIGTWKLVYQQAHHATGPIIYPRGENASGVLMYDASGNMSVQLMRADHQSGDLADFRVAMEGYLAYFGTYHVDEMAGTVIHEIEGCSYPGWIGTDQVRHFMFDGDQLTLSADGISADGSVEKRVLVWERAA